MANSPWLALQQAREALRLGQPEAAHQLLTPLIAEGYRHALRLVRPVAELYLDRAEDHLNREQIDAAWLDLLAAESLVPGFARCERLRHILTRFGLSQCRAALEASQPLGVIEVITKLRERQVHEYELTLLEAVAQEWILAAEHADRGEFETAKTIIRNAVQRIATLPHITAGVERFQTHLSERASRFHQSIAIMIEHSRHRCWDAALQAADDALANAPNSQEARMLRLKAWQALQPTAESIPVESDHVEPIIVLQPASTMRGADRSSVPIARRTAPMRAASVASPTASTHEAFAPPLPKRFLLWIDGVAGFLVCLNDRLSIGQAMDQGPVDIPLQAEMARIHATLCRDTEGYTIESTRGVLVNDNPIQRQTLKHGDRLTFGSTCQLSFHLPVPISPSARLQLMSGHRLPQAVDGVLLMAEALILGPSETSHVQMPPDLPDNIVLYRSRQGLGVRVPGEFTVDNKPCLNRAELPLPSIVEAETFRFAVEPIGPRL